MNNRKEGSFLKILVINAGSSSLKYQLFDMDTGEVLAKGLCEYIGTAGTITHKRPGKEPYKAELPFPTHDEALAEVLRLLTDPELGVIGSVDEIDAVGHRIAHGGKYQQSTVIDDEVVAYLESIVPINPLHGPPAIKGINGCRRLMGDKVHVGVFDTAFYSHMPPHSYIYPLPYELYEQKQIRRYGFHGTSHRYVSQRIAKLLDRPLEELKLVTCHIGNGSSITAVQNGVAVDTSMGFTPQEGIPMGTRSGSVDPTVLTYLINSCGMSGQDVEDMINRRSGLLGVSGVSNDCRAVTAAAEEGNERAKLAIDILVHDIKKVIGGYVAEMGGLDALIFTAGIGENQSDIREMVCRGMDVLGIAIDSEKNRAAHGVEADISAPGARAATWVVPTDEEYMIALDTAAFAQKP